MASPTAPELAWIRDRSFSRRFMLSNDSLGFDPAALAINQYGPIEDIRYRGKRLPSLASVDLIGNLEFERIMWRVTRRVYNQVFWEIERRLRHGIQ